VDEPWKPWVPHFHSFHTPYRGWNTVVVETGSTVSNSDRGNVEYPRWPLARLNHHLSVGPRCPCLAPGVTSQQGYSRGVRAPPSLTLPRVRVASAVRNNDLRTVVRSSCVTQKSTPDQWLACPAIIKLLLYFKYLQKLRAVLSKSGRARCNEHPARPDHNAKDRGSHHG
jgi:hypothetical protein